MNAQFLSFLMAVIRVIVAIAILVVPIATQDSKGVVIEKQPWSIDAPIVGDPVPPVKGRLLPLWRLMLKAKLLRGYSSRGLIQFILNGEGRKWSTKEEFFGNRKPNLKLLLKVLALRKETDQIKICLLNHRFNKAMKYLLLLGLVIGLTLVQTDNTTLGAALPILLIPIKEKGGELKDLQEKNKQLPSQVISQAMANQDTKAGYWGIVKALGLDTSLAYKTAKKADLEDLLRAYIDNLQAKELANTLKSYQPSENAVLFTKIGAANSVNVKAQLNSMISNVKLSLKEQYTMTP